MIHLVSLLTAIALTLPGPWYRPGSEPETPLERAQRIQTIVEAIALETAEPPELWPWPAEDLALAVLVMTWSESGRWRLEVHHGSRMGDKGRARCLAQVWPGFLATRSEWRRSAGSDLESTRLCVRLAVRHLTFHADRCRVPMAPSERQMARIFSGYASGYSCSPRWLTSVSRAALWGRLRARTTNELVSLHPL